MKVKKLLACVAALFILTIGFLITDTDVYASSAEVPKKANEYRRGTYHVAKDGTGDFTSIATAVALVQSGSTLIIHEGVYNEAMSIQTKAVNMRGVSRENCVIQYDTSEYATVPLNIVSGAYENLTIYGYHKAESKGMFCGYAVHIDCDTMVNQTVRFSNCNIISENTYCLGIGLRKGTKIVLNNCNLTSKKQGCILFHDSQTPQLAGKANIVIENCTFNNSAENLIVTQCISPSSRTDITFRNNTVIGNGDGYCVAFSSYVGEGAGWLGAQNVFLTPNSTGNNIVSFNYK